MDLISSASAASILARRQSIDALFGAYLVIDVAILQTRIVKVVTGVATGGRVHAHSARGVLGTTPREGGAAGEQKDDSVPTTHSEFSFVEGRPRSSAYRGRNATTRHLSRAVARLGGGATPQATPVRAGSSTDLIPIEPFSTPGMGSSPHSALPTS